jgi:alpha-ribazole phosphatase
MEVYLIRHTTPNISKEICYGQTDIGINETLFQQELQLIQSKLPNDIEQFYTSPLQRCKILAEKLNPDFILDERLKELNFGDWENKGWNEIEQNGLNKWMQDFVNIKTPNGENYIDLNNRTQSFISEILKLNLQKIAIVTHAGNIRSFLSLVLSLPLENSFRINLNYGSVVSIELDKLEFNNKLNSIF